MKSIHIRYFGLLGDRRGVPEETIGTTASTASALYAELDRVHGLGAELAHLRVAVNDHFTGWDHELRDGDQVAFLPPMSGG